MSSFLLKKKTKQSFLEGIQTLEYSTRTNYLATLKQFEKFCYSNYDKKNIQDVVDEIKSLKPEDKDEAFIGALQDFVNCLVKANLANTTIQKYFQ